MFVNQHKDFRYYLLNIISKKVSNQANNSSQQWTCPFSIKLTLKEAAMLSEETCQSRRG
jgi:hypothetical protein